MQYNIEKNIEDEVDKEVLKNKIDCWTEKIEKGIESNETKTLDSIKEKLKDYRKSGLEKDGELSIRKNFVNANEIKFNHRNEQIILSSELDELTTEQAEYLGIPVAGPFKSDMYRY